MDERTDQRLVEVSSNPVFKSVPQAHAARERKALALQQLTDSLELPSPNTLLLQTLWMEEYSCVGCVYEIWIEAESCQPWYLNSK